MVAERGTSDNSILHEVEAIIKSAGLATVRPTSIQVLMKRAPSQRQHGSKTAVMAAAGVSEPGSSHRAPAENLKTIAEHTKQSIARTADRLSGRWR
jgi:hypothetical protein